jgi:flavin-dependent dehydrogenase
VAGRDQDWNISREELLKYVAAGVLSREQAMACVTIEFNPIRAGFAGFADIATDDVLNLGVSPRKLIATVLDNYRAAGGVVLETCELENVWVHPNGVQVRFREGSSVKSEQQGREQMAIASKLFVDSMGNGSPIVRQIRHASKPDGVCMVVGSCCRGFDEESNASGDIIRTIEPSDTAANLQLFWEAFPAGSGPQDRTTYMFSYMDAEKSRPSFDQLMAMYWEKMPSYQNVNLSGLSVQRILFGLFPTYADAPLPPKWDRIIQIGDASGLQSPLSFGGFTALARHVGRLADAITDAVESDCLDRYKLKFVNPYSPSLSSAWMFQKAMSINPSRRRVDPNFINRLLGSNFQIMSKDDTVLKPFLQDVIMARELTATLVNVMKDDILFVPAIVATVGIPALIDWTGHYLLLTLYAGITQLVKANDVRQRVEGLDEKQAKLRYVLRRALERWEYGSGLDYFSDDNDGHST